jgi:hypothetical protein
MEDPPINITDTAEIFGIVYYIKSILLVEIQSWEFFFNIAGFET